MHQEMNYGKGKQLSIYENLDNLKQHYGKGKISYIKNNQVQTGFGNPSSNLTIGKSLAKLSGAQHQTTTPSFTENYQSLLHPKNVRPGKVNQKYSLGDSQNFESMNRKCFNLNNSTQTNQGSDQSKRRM